MQSMFSDIIESIAETQQEASKTLEIKQYTFK